MFKQADIIPFIHQESEEKEPHELLFCTHCDSLQWMETITPARQDASEKRILAERVRRCSACNRQYVTTEVLSDLVYQHDQIRNYIDQVCQKLASESRK